MLCLHFTSFRVLAAAPAAKAESKKPKAAMKYVLQCLHGCMWMYLIGLMHALWCRLPIAGTEWVLVKASDGKIFYYNSAQKKSFWQKPDALKDTPLPSFSDGAPH